MTTQTIHETMAEQISLATAYAEDGAFFSAAQVLKRLSQTVHAHADACYRAEHTMGSGDAPGDPDHAQTYHVWHTASPLTPAQAVDAGNAAAAIRRVQSGASTLAALPTKGYRATPANVPVVGMPPVR